MNCILYIQLPTDIDPEYFKKMEHYARMRCWYIIGLVSDEYKDVLKKLTSRICVTV